MRYRNIFERKQNAEGKIMGGLDKKNPKSKEEPVEVLVSEEEKTEQESEIKKYIDKYFKRKEPKVIDNTKYYRHDGVAHVGADVPGERVKEQMNKEKVYEELEKKFKPEKKGMKPRSSDDFPVTTRGKFTKGRFPKENLKTLKKQKSKMERTKRGKIREVLHNPEEFLKE